MSDPLHPGCGCRHDGWYDPKCPCCNRRRPWAATPVADDEATAIRLLEEALHLRMNGERAPGGNETWRDWDMRAEQFLQERLARLRGE